MKEITKTMGIVFTSMTLIAATAFGAMAFSSTALASTTAAATKEYTYAQSVTIAQKEVKGTLLEIEIDYSLGQKYYEIDILDSADKKHELIIDASTGKITHHQISKVYPKKATQLRTAKITHDQSIKIATAEMLKTAVFDSSSLDYEDDYGKLVYEVKFEDGRIDSKVVIDAKTGTVLDVESED